MAPVPHAVTTSPMVIRTHDDGLLSPSIAMGPYTLVKELGRGGMASVYLAVGSDGGTRKPFVVKCLHAHLASDPSSVGAFREEARIHEQLDHPSVPRFEAFGEDRGQPYLAMEYLRGRDLRVLLDAVEGPLEPNVAVGIALAVLDVLAYAHDEAGPDGGGLAIVHRDVSPHNIFVCHDGRVALLDFGIARPVGEGQTATGIVKGRFAYISPEQAQADRVDQRADVWSVGAVLWEMLAGRQLFDAGNDFAVLAASILADAPSLREAAPTVPPELVEIVHRALQRDLEGRFASARAMADALRAWTQARGAPDLAGVMASCFPGGQEAEDSFIEAVAVHAPPAPATGRRGWGPRLAVGLGLVLMVGGAALLWGPGDSPEGPVSTPPRPGGTLAVAASPTRPGEPFGAPSPPGAQEVPNGGSPSTPGPGSESLPARETRVPAAAASRGTGRGPVPEPDTTLKAGAAERPPQAEPTAAKQGGRALPAKTPDRGADPAVARGTGKVTLLSNPWAEVIWRGRVLGMTPLMDHQLPAGTHTLTLRNPAQGLSKRIRVTVEPGKPVRRRIELQ